MKDEVEGETLVLMGDSWILSVMVVPSSLACCSFSEESNFLI